jgi:hypothetical protein
VAIMLKKLVLFCFLVSSFAIPARAQNWKSFQDEYSKARGNCPECQEGEAMAMSTVTIPHSGYVDIDRPPCGDPSFNSVKIPQDVRTAAAAYFYAQGAGPVGAAAAYFTVGLSEQLINLVAAAGSDNGGEIGRLIRRSTNQPQVSSCGRAMVTAPKSVNVQRIVPSMDCPAGGWCELASQPTTEEVDENLFAASVVGKNWSHNHSASVILKLFYKR